LERRQLECFLSCFSYSWELGFHSVKGLEHLLGWKLGLPSGIECGGVSVVPLDFMLSCSAQMSVCKIAGGLKCEQEDRDVFPQGYRTYEHKEKTQPQPPCFGLVLGRTDWMWCGPGFSEGLVVQLAVTVE
jgi:hypothetical protein